MSKELTATGNLWKKGENKRGPRTLGDLDRL